MHAMPPERRAFTWERPPFSRCAKCQLDTFGFLSGGGRSITWRCSACGYRVNEPLPALDKRVIYLDQFAFSELFKLKGGIRREDALTPFWQELDGLLHRVVRLQQAVLPHSDVHHSETLVSAWPRALREAYQAIGGDLSFDDTRDIELREIAAFAQAFIEGREPTINLSVDEILRGRRNEWLPDMRVVVNADYSRFAEGLRKGVKQSGQSIANLMEGWRQRGLGFKEVLAIELSAYRDSRIGAFQEFNENYARAMAGGDAMAIMNLSISPIVREISILRHVFRDAGINEANQDSMIDRFWSWERNREMPSGRILAFMFAALAGQVKAGRKKPVTGSFMNDVRAIAAYAPFVDVMFVDKECAAILADGRVQRGLNYRARIFSLSSKDDFLAYLHELEATATEEIRLCAGIMYGLDAQTLAA